MLSDSCLPIPHDLRLLSRKYVLRIPGTLESLGEPLLCSTCPVPRPPTISMTLTRRRPSLAPLRLGSISEEEAPGMLNLGVESPSSILEPSSAAGQASPDEWLRSGIAVNTNVPMRRRSWRSLSWLQEKHRRTFFRSETRDDCGICFESAILPIRVKCCLQLFCFAHLSDWLGSEQSDGLCPSCRKPCSLSTDAVSLASTPKNEGHPELVQPPLPRRAPSPSSLICPPTTPRFPSSATWVSGRENHTSSGSGSLRELIAGDDETGSELDVARTLSYFAFAIVLFVLFSGS